MNWKKFLFLNLSALVIALMAIMIFTDQIKNPLTVPVMMAAAAGSLVLGLESND